MKRTSNHLLLNSPDDEVDRAEGSKTIQLQVMMQAAQQYAHDVGNSSSIPISSSSFGQMLELMADGGQFGTNSYGVILSPFPLDRRGL